MKNILVIYWSGTGNTEKMAVAVAEGARSDEITVELRKVGQATKEDVRKAEAVALGCPAMGSEVLEEMEMEPFIQSLAGEDIQAKPLALFGSYDWGDGQWMRDWQERMLRLGVRLADEGLLIQNTPEADGLARCRALGKKLAAMIGEDSMA